MLVVQSGERRHSQTHGRVTWTFVHRWPCSFSKSYFRSSRCSFARCTTPGHIRQTSPSWAFGAALVGFPSSKRPLKKLSRNLNRSGVGSCTSLRTSRPWTTTCGRFRHCSLPCTQSCTFAPPFARCRGNWRYLSWRATYVTPRLRGALTELSRGHSPMRAPCASAAAHRASSGKDIGNTSIATSALLLS